MSYRTILAAINWGAEKPHKKKNKFLGTEVPRNFSDQCSLDFAYFLILGGFSASEGIAKAFCACFVGYRTTTARHVAKRGTAQTDVPV